MKNRTIDDTLDEILIYVTRSNFMRGTKNAAEARSKAKAALKSLFVAVVGEDKPAWDAGKYQIIEDALGNGAEQLYSDMKLGYDQAKREIKTRINNL